MAFTDRKLQCRDCPDEFVFTAGEQEFYASKGLEHDPVRCPNCRQQRKSSSGLESNDTPRYGVYASYGGRTPRQLFVASADSVRSLPKSRFDHAMTDQYFALIVTANKGKGTRLPPLLKKKQRLKELRLQQKSKLN